MPRVISATIGTLLGLAAWLPAFGQERPLERIEVRVLPMAVVAGAEFTLGDVAELDGFDVEAIAKLAQLSLGRSPLPGRTLRLNASFIKPRLAKIVDAQRVHLQVPPGAEVRRAAQVVSGEVIAARVLALAAEQAGTGPENLEQELVGRVRDAVLPKGEVAWQIALMGRHMAPGGSRTYRVLATVNGEEAWRALVRVKQSVYGPSVIAKRPIRRNQIIAAEDVTAVRRKLVGSEDQAALTATADVIGLRAKRPIGRDEPIHPGMVAAVAAVVEGGSVTMVYQTDRLRLRAPGVALASGRIGEFIPVRNLHSGKVVYGVVQRHDSVRVK